MTTMTPTGSPTLVKEPVLSWGIAPAGLLTRLKTTAQGLTQPVGLAPRVLHRLELRPGRAGSAVGGATPAGCSTASSVDLIQWI